MIQQARKEAPKLKVVARPLSTEHPPLPSRQDALCHADGLYNLARHLAGSAADAEDLVQDTFTRAFGAWDRLAPGTNLKAWLYRILRNRFLDRVRHEQVLPTEMGDGAALEMPETDGEEAFLRGDRELESMRHLVGREIEAALADLREESRTVILLDLEGLSEAEMAMVIGCPVGTIKSRLHRARTTLRKILSDYRR